MAASSHPLTARFLQGRLRHAMPSDERDALESAIGKVERVASSHVLLQRGECLDRSTMLIEGFMARIIVEQGKRHIVCLHVPGDFVDLHAFALKRLDHSIMTIGPAMLGYVPHDRLQEILETKPHLARLLWFSTLMDAAIHRQWILKLEQLAADGRVAHLVCELWHRLGLVGLGDSSGFALPLTQQDLADACGTTAIHMNRILRKLREAGLVEIFRGRVTVADRTALEAYAQFDPSYLYGKGDLAPGHELDA